MGKTRRASKKQSAPADIDLNGQSIAFFGTFSYWPSYHGGEPADVARRLGARVQTDVDEDLDLVVFGDLRGTGRAQAKKKVEKLHAKTLKENKKAKDLRPQVLDEAAFREMVRLDVRGKRFAFFGGFDCCPSGFEDGMLTRMVESVGGKVQTEVDEKLDYLILGNRRGPGKIAAQHRAEKLSGVAILHEDGFLELVRKEQPKQQTGMDFAGFITQLYGTVDNGKLGRALTMLKAESFKLFVRLSDEHLVGVVRSQTGAGSVYASWLTPEGRYGCSQPDLTDCMGLQGSPCKHLLVLLVGLARTGQMDPARAYAWIHAASNKRPRHDQELAAETLLQYKGAEAGEIDWRPTETIPEDFYAF
jgi:BRCT domain type II-containing protein